MEPHRNLALLVVLVEGLKCREETVEDFITSMAPAIYLLLSLP
jgi:hypothetical protein